MICIYLTHTFFLVMTLWNLFVGNLVPFLFPVLNRIHTVIWTELKHEYSRTIYSETLRRCHRSKQRLHSTTLQKILCSVDSDLNWIVSQECDLDKLYLKRFKPKPSDRNIYTKRDISKHCWAQHVERTLLASLLGCVAICWVLLAQIWKWSNFSCSVCGCYMML